MSRSNLPQHRKVENVWNADIFQLYPRRVEREPDRECKLGVHQERVVCYRQRLLVAPLKFGLNLADEGYWDSFLVVIRRCVKVKDLGDLLHRK